MRIVWWILAALMGVFSLGSLGALFGPESTGVVGGVLLIISVGLTVLFVRLALKSKASKAGAVSPQATPAAKPAAPASAVAEPKAAHPQPAAQSDMAAAKVGSSDVVAASFGGSMTFNGREVIIRRKGGTAFFIHGLAGEKVIAISAIQAVQLRQPRGGVRGYLQLSVLGGVEAQRGAFNAAGDENSLLFDKADTAAFEHLAQMIRDAIYERGKPVVVTASVSAAEELSKFAALRDQGVITEDEFQAKKTQLL